MKKLNIVVFGFIYILSGYSHASVEESKIGGLNILLDNEKCSLVIDGKVLNVGIKPKCYFVKHSVTGSIRVKYYNDIKSYVLLIVGTSAPKDPDYPLTLVRSDCGRQMQALIIKNKMASLSSRVFSGSLTCAGVGVDEKEYYILSHP